MNATRRPAENSRVVLGVALALWAASVALAGSTGALRTLGLPLGATVAAFATLFAVMTYYLDAGVHSTVDAIDARTLIALLVVGLVAIAWFLLGKSPFEAVSRMPWALCAFFVAPVTIALQVALLDRLLRAPASGTPSSSENRETNAARTAVA